MTVKTRIIPAHKCTAHAAAIDLLEMRRTLDLVIGTGKSPCCNEEVMIRTEQQVAHSITCMKCGKAMDEVVIMVDVPETEVHDIEGVWIPPENVN